MTPLDDRLFQAVEDLRQDVDALAAPPFSAKRRVVPAMLALVLLLGLGVAAVVLRPAAGDDGGVAVATQPEPPVESMPEPPRITSSEDQVLTAPQFGQLTMAGVGEFMMPLPAGQAWSPDETRVVMYRTGSADPGHFVLDITTGQLVGPAALPFTPADIEQVYWLPGDSNVLVFTTGVDVVSYDLATERSQVQRSFEQCDRVDSGVLPVPPSDDGTLSLLCHVGTARSLLAYNLLTGQVREGTTLGDTAAMPSPSGRNLVRWNDDGSASVLDADLVATGITLDLDNNPFVFLSEASGREWIAATVFDGPVVGTAVLFPLDGVDSPIVVIGPDRGDVYPPSGTSISAAGTTLAVSVRGADDGVLQGRIVAVDLGPAPFSPATVAAAERVAFAHSSAAVHGYWSTPFLSVSPSGDYVVYSTDSGGDRVDTWVVDLAAATN